MVDEDLIERLNKRDETAVKVLIQKVERYIELVCGVDFFKNLEKVEIEI